MKKLSEKLFEIEQLVHAIIEQGNDPLYTVIDQGKGVVRVTPTPLTKRLSSTVKNYLYPLLNQFPIHEFNPYINAFFRSVINTNVMESIEQQASLNKRHNRYQTDGDYPVMQELMTRMHACVDQIRAETKSAAFRTIIYNANRLSKKNQDGMMHYIDSLFDHYSKLIVVRIDLGYQKGNHIINQADIPKKYWQARSHFKHFLNNTRRNSLFEHLVGNIWSFEYGPEKGFHYHLILFFDGSKVRQDVILARMVGDYWVKCIVGSQGRIWNCNANKDTYPDCGIGLIHFSDTEKREHLNQAAAYLIKIDHYVRMLTPGDGRTFGRGEILPPKTGNIGRPRSK
ncbi:hypothetical protein A1359_07300 [Methylomonas lenta]|uniref:YagK/YfjJ C-terminal domain-containing protein n=1 Tax=Methylomonas lenta TaxID=980561 RepID=A0A177NHA9_9GAMM|nr:inovirus-type Gp2 protein [Methylomonas lenta]OAI16450.1 hypothetical protein A1359_07300 [Methylomonas lenta]